MAKPKHVAGFKENHARPAESVVTACDGYTKQRGANGMKEVSGVLVLTDQRVVFYRKGLFGGEHLVGVELRELSSVDQTSSFGTHTLSIRSHSVAIEFSTYIRKIGVRKLVEEIEAQRAAVSERASAPGGVAEELRKLSELTNEGILSEDEFERAKGMFIGKPVPKQDEATRLLRNLHELHRQGALSESEFNMKKWDILSKA